jgi:quinol monooxygenase YgiN
VIAVHRFDMSAHGDERLQDELEGLLAVLSQRTGFVRGQVARAVDEPAAWIVLTEWEGVGAYRRGLSSYDVKLLAPLLGRARPEASAFEVVTGS